jgi:hypothetical protein
MSFKMLSSTSSSTTVVDCNLRSVWEQSRHVSAEYNKGNGGAYLSQLLPELG